MQNPLKPQTRNLTINRLPADLVIDFKTLACQLECTVEELGTIVLQEAIKNGDRYLMDVHRLRNAKKQERETQRLVKKQLDTLVPQLGIAQ
jgi:hypothetical protein